MYWIDNFAELRSNGKGIMSDVGIWRTFSLAFGSEGKKKKISEKQPKPELLLIQSQNNGVLDLHLE